MRTRVVTDAFSGLSSPQGYDDIPEKIPDKDAKKPEDWDDEDDGEWEPPLIANPEYKGPWVQKTIANPDYKGIWEAPDIPNPEFKDDPKLYAFKDIANVGFELWQVKAGSIFDNILVTDDRKYAAEFAEKTWGKSKEAEKKMFDEVKEEERKKEEARRGPASHAAWMAQRERSDVSSPRAARSPAPSLSIFAGGAQEARG